MSTLFERYWPLIEPVTLLSRSRAEWVFRLARESLLLEGDFIECGACDGGISLLLGALLKENGVKKRVFICDSFQGLPEPNRTFDQKYDTGLMRGDRARLEETIASMKLADQCIVREGWFQDIFPQFAPGQKFSFAHVDCDLFSSVSESAAFVFPRLAEGGAVVFDDYFDGSGGARAAVDRFFSNRRETYHLGPPPQLFVVKGFSKNPSAATFSLGGFQFSTGRLKADPAFAALVKQFEVWDYPDKILSRVLDR